MTNHLQRHGLVLGGLLLGACGGSGGESSGNHIRFDSVEIGQRSHYFVLLGEVGFDSTSSPFEYVEGILVAEIVSRDAVGFRVREAFASAAEVDERVRDWLDATGVYEYYLSVEDGAIRVLPAGAELQSRLFSRELKLADVADPVVEILGWTTTLPLSAGLAEAAIIEGEILGTTYPRLNVFVDNEDIPVDGPGATWIYGATHGVVRSTRYSLDAQIVTGFDLLPD